MPSSRSRRRVEIPVFQYDRVKELADAEDRTVASVVAELLGAALRSYQPPPASSPPAERFTPRARRALELVQTDVPREFDHSYVGTEHLLLALLDEGEGLAAKVLRGTGLRRGRVAETLLFIVGRGGAKAKTPPPGYKVEDPGGPFQGQPGYTPRMKKVIGLAEKEATRLDHGFIGTGHLLLGLLREGAGIAIGMLHDLGVEPERLREDVLAALRRPDMPLAES